MKQYIGITIGPIFDTISDASTPAALWFASTLFSDITRRICLKLEATFIPLTIYSPFLDENDKKGLTDGVGKYHDRIIFSIEEHIIDKVCMEQGKTLEKVLDDLLVDVKRRTIVQIEHQAENFSREDTEDLDKRYDIDALKFLEQYIQLNYIIMTEEEVGDTNCILKLSPYLDALELMKTFPENDADNPIRYVMERDKKYEDKEKDEEENDNSNEEEINKKGEEGKISGKNQRIKRSWLFSKLSPEKNQFLCNNKKHIRKIEKIANCNGDVSDTLKYGDYYAVVSADADGMGNFLNSITNEEVTYFSECCMDYDKNASGLITAFKGMTIYAGGDDLLFLAPVKTPDDDKSIFQLCKEISDLFKKTVEEKMINGKTVFAGKPIPTVSFGISIQFHKFPLYEALNQARHMLEEAKSRKYEVSNQAKDTLSAKLPGDAGQEKEKVRQNYKELKKNCIVFNLEKHSGRSIRLLIGNEAISSFCDFVSYVSDKTDDKKLKGIIAHLETLYHVITTLDTVKVKPLLARRRAEGIDQLSEEEKQFYETQKKEFWDNLFDNQGQQYAKEFVQYICGTYYTDMIEKEMRYAAIYMEDEYKTKAKDTVTHQDNPYPNEKLNVLIEILRYCMFLKEKAGE